MFDASDNEFEQISKLSGIKIARASVVRSFLRAQI